MKKYFILVLALLFAVSVVLTGCAPKAPEPEPDKPEGPQVGGDPSAAVAGGWEIYDGSEMSIVTDEERAIFEKATEEMVGADLEPVAVLATQLVAGMNYAFLCTSTPVVPNAQTNWIVAVVYKDLQGNATVTFVRDLDLADLKEQEHAPEDDGPVSGGWQVPEEANAAALPENAQKAFETAMDGYVGLSLSPAALLATQLVAGTNYEVLCYGTMVTASPVTGLYAVRIYADLQGGAEITEVEELDLFYYVTPDIE